MYLFLSKDLGYHFNLCSHSGVLYCGVFTDIYTKCIYNQEMFRTDFHTSAVPLQDQTWRCLQISQKGKLDMRTDTSVGVL